jgi:hypothetical protein
LPKIKGIEISSQERERKKKVGSSFNIKMYEKQKRMEEQALANPRSEMVRVIDYKVQNDSTDFLVFQRTNYSKYDQIQALLFQVENFTKHYQIRDCTLDLTKVLQLVNANTKTQKAFNVPNNNSAPATRDYGAHQLLGCFENGEEISEAYQNSCALKFYGRKGKIRAATIIQASWRRKAASKKARKLQEMCTSARTIQKAYRNYRRYQRTKDILFQNSLEKYARFAQRQKEFQCGYRLNEMTKRIKYEIHICSDSQSEWQRLSSHHFAQKQNSYITRIFRAFRNTAIETRVILVTANPIPNDILGYYNKLLELGGADHPRNRVIFMSVPQNGLPDGLPLPRMLYYCPSLVAKIKGIVGSNYGYIVPATPSNDYVHICDELNLPLYSSAPQPLLALQTNSGCKTIIEELNKNEPSFCILPFAKDIYSLKYLISQMTVLVLAHPHVGRWVLKIDNEFDSRGLAFVEVNKLLPRKMLKHIRKVYNEFAPTNSK